MPLTTTAPVSVVSILADKFEVTDININARANTITVVWQAFLAGALVRGDSLTVSAASYAALKPSGTKTYYENLKALAYKIGQDTGVFPAGTVS